MTISEPIFCVLFYFNWAMQKSGGASSHGQHPPGMNHIIGVSISKDSRGDYKSIEIPWAPLFLLRMSGTMDINHTPAVSGIRRVPRFPGQLDFVHLGAPRLVATYNPCRLAMADVAHVVR